MLDTTALEMAEAFSRTGVGRSEDFDLLQSITTTATEKLGLVNQNSDAPPPPNSSSNNNNNNSSSAIFTLKDAKYYYFVVKEFEAREAARRQREETVLRYTLPSWEAQVTDGASRRRAAHTWFAMGEEVRELLLESLRETYGLERPWTPTTTAPTAATAAATTTTPDDRGDGGRRGSARRASSSSPPPRGDAFLSLSTPSCLTGDPATTTASIHRASPFALLPWTGFLFPSAGHRPASTGSGTSGGDHADRESFHPLLSASFPTDTNGKTTTSTTGEAEGGKKPLFTDKQVRQCVGIAVRASHRSLWKDATSSQQQPPQPPPPPPAGALLSLVGALYPCLAAAATLVDATAATGTAKREQEVGKHASVFLPGSLQAPLKATTRAALHATRRCWLELLLLFTHTVLWATIAEGGADSQSGPAQQEQRGANVYGYTVELMRTRRIVSHAAAALLQQERALFDRVLQQAVAVTAKLQNSLS